MTKPSPDLFDWTPPPKPLPEPRKDRAFDGDTYEPESDYIRLKGQLGEVFEFMKDGAWHTIPEITNNVTGSPQSVSARLRDLRKDKYGGHTVERMSLGQGLFTYRLEVSKSWTPR